MRSRTAGSPTTPLDAGEERWRRLGGVSPGALVTARTQLHHAAQVANAAAISLLPPEADDSHTNFEWIDALGALVARRIPATQPFRVALRPADLALAVVHGDDVAAAVYPLSGRTRDDAFAWLVEQVALSGADASRMTMRRHYEIPGEPPDAAHPFALAGGAAFHELAAYWSDADHLLRAVARAIPGASEVRCWPHHFDIATLITEPTAATRTTIGVGLSPGDEYYAEPYLYVSPYPYPDTSALPPLEVGSWHTTGWVGAVLPGTSWVRATEPAEQRWLAVTFIYAAIAVVRRLRDREPPPGR